MQNCGGVLLLCQAHSTASKVTASKESEVVNSQHKKNKRILLVGLGPVAVIWLLMFFSELLITKPWGGSAKDSTDLAVVGAWRASNAMVYVAVLHFAIAAITVYLLIKTLKETREMLRQAKLANEAANEANGYNREMLEISRRASIEENKPYIRATSFSLDKIVEKNDRVMAMFVFTLKNTGNTAARDFHNFKVELVDVLSPSNEPDTRAQITDVQVSIYGKVSVLIPHDSVDIGGRITFARIPPFGLNIDPL